MTSSFSDNGRAAVLDRPAEISRSEVNYYQRYIIHLNQNFCFISKKLIHVK